MKDEPNETLINELKHIWESEGIFIVIENIKRLQFECTRPAYIVLLTSRWGDQSPGRRHGLLAAHPIKFQVQERVELSCAIGSLIRDFQ